MSYIKFLKNESGNYLSSWSIIIYILLLIATYFNIISLDSPIYFSIYIIMWISSIIGLIITYFNGHIIRKRIKTDKKLRYIILFSKILILLSLLLIRPYKNTKINSIVLKKSFIIIMIYVGIYISYLKSNNKSLIYLYGF